MKQQMFAHTLFTNLGRASFDVYPYLLEVNPKDTILLSYELYIGMLAHPSFKGYYVNYDTGRYTVIDYVIPGRVMSFKSGHIVVVI